MISLVEGNGCVDLRTNLFSPVKSVTRRTLFPSAFGTKNAGLHHIVASLTGVSAHSRSYMSIHADPS